MMTFTSHAVERFIERIRPDLSHTDALALLQSVAASAVQARERTAQGDAYYRVDDPPCVLIVQKRARPGGRESLLCTTVITVAMFTREVDEDDADEVLAAYRRATGAASSPPPDPAPVEAPPAPARAAAKVTPLTQANEQIVALRKRLARNVAAVVDTTQRLTRTKQALRLLMRYAAAHRGDPELERALRAVVALFPDALADDFLHPGRYTKDERRTMREARTTA